MWLQSGLPETMAQLREFRWLSARAEELALNVEPDLFHLGFPLFWAYGLYLAQLGHCLKTLFPICSPRTLVLCLPSPLGPLSAWAGVSELE